MYNLFLIYAPILSYIIMFFAVIVLIAWTFGTDVYDYIEREILYNDDYILNFVVHVILSVVLTIIFLCSKNNPVISFMYAIWSFWLCIIVIFIFIVILECIRNWCLSKRGKK